MREKRLVAATPKRLPNTRLDADQGGAAARAVDDRVGALPLGGACTNRAAADGAELDLHVGMVRRQSAVGMPRS